MASIFTQLARFGNRRLRHLIGFVLIGFLLTFFWIFKKSHVKVSSNEQEIRKVFDHLYEFHVEVRKRPMQIIPEQFLNLHKCPACFGNDACKAIEEKDIKITIPAGESVLTSKGVYFGEYMDNFIVAKTLGKEEDKQRFDQYMCKNITGSSDCDIGKAIISSSSFIHKPEALSPETLNVIHRKISTRPHLFTTCANKELIDVISLTYRSWKEMPLSASEKANLLFSAVLNPEMLVIKFADEMATPYSIPAQYGSCGRLVIEEAIGMTMDKVLEMSWTFRAEVAAQLLDMIDNSVNGDSKWYLLMTEFWFENFALFADGHLVLIDLEDTVLVPKETTTSTKSTEVCNTACLDEYERSVIHYKGARSQDVCNRLVKQSLDYMYYHVCQVLSAEKEHKPSYRSDKDTDEYKTGVLHDAPDTYSDKLHEALSECIEEKVPGGRLQAVEKLQSYLREISYENFEPEEDV